MGTVQELVSSKQFGPLDFLEHQKSQVAGEADVLEVVTAYASKLQGDESRRKYHAKRAATVKSLLTPSGVRKLRDCKIETRMRIEANAKEALKTAKIPPLDGAFAVPDNPWALIKVVQRWGDHGEDNARYYLHMVFRYQMRLLHKACVERGEVLEVPSLQHIVDILHPSKCSSKFPPEFKRFMHECSEISVNVVSLPVPKRDNAKEVDYSHNFEANPAVSALRRKMQRTITHWKCQDVYPVYLLKGRPGNDAIIKAVALAVKARERRKLASQADSASAIGRISASVSRLAGISDQYEASDRKTKGERLKERLGFFLRPSVRSIFVEVRDNGLVEDVFDLTRRSYDHFHNFDVFCTANEPMPFLDTDDDECRRLLLMLESIVSMFGIDYETEANTAEPCQIVRDAIAEIET